MRVRSQHGGGAYVDDYAMLAVTGGSSIDDNTASTASSPVSLSVLSSWLVRQETIDARLLKRDIDFAMLEPGGDAGLACVSARSTEEAPTWMTFPCWR